MNYFSPNSGVTTLEARASYYSGNTVVFDGVVAYDTGCCGDWALYYVNARGGWDSFLIEGKVKRTDAVTHFEYSNANDTRKQYMSEVEPAYEMHTGWLTDSQSEILAHNLIPSVKVYAHNLNENKLFPVVITDTSVEWKTFKNEKKLVSYTINVVAGDKETRR